VASLSRLARSPVEHCSGPAPYGASRDGPPAPRRLEQPSPGTSPISDVSTSPHEHRHAGTRTDGKLARRASFDVRRSIDPRIQDRRSLCSLRCESMRRSRRLRSCRDRPGFPRGRRAALAPFFGELRAARALFSPRSRRCVRQHVARNPPRPVPRPPLSLRIAEGHGTGVRRTDLCLLTSSYEHPRLVGSRCVERGKRLRTLGRSPASRQCDSLRRAARSSEGGIAAGVVFPWRCVQAVPLAPLSPSSRRTPRSRARVPS